jgi:hypothetical protein
MAKEIMASRLTLLNTSIITLYGTYEFKPLTLEEARGLIVDFQKRNCEIQSAIGHQTTADLLTYLLDYPVTVNRMEFNQTIDDVALVFRLRGRPPEGRVLSREELEEIGYEFGQLMKLSEVV